jgi:RNA polymerase sigma-70 factor, ECF subfamily
LNHDGSVISGRARKLLILRAQKGDPEALNILFDSCRRSLYCRALRILARPQDAEDAVQEAMLAAFTHLDKFQGRADFLTWASRIVINAALQHIRKHRTKPTVSWDQAEAELEGTSFTEYIRDPQPSPEEQLQELEYRQMFEEAVRRLPLESRRAIQLCRSADYSLKEAASALGMSLSTLKSRLHRGKRDLVVRLKRETQVRHRPLAKKRRFEVCPASEENLRAA